ncbi:hypothetical protein AGMMS4956_01960 [Bacteroidia bacterium]|nr:hypothetical protein AGMMS4956_01960 [Bacteroidia bacterium]
MSLRAQVLTGTVRDDNGGAVSRATIYVEELQMGTTTDDDGEFSLRLREGNYTCVFQKVGHSSITQQVNVPAKGLNIEVEMPIKTYAIQAVVVSNSKEDPAYGIMRQVIGMAPYYSNQVESYKAEVYIKGSAKVDKISRIVKTLAKKELKQLDIQKGTVLLLESLNEITFKAPNDFHHKVISTQNTLPADFKGLNTMNFVQVNVYQTNIVSRDAFRNYKFSYEGFSEDNGLTINKIRITPRTKNPVLLSGYIYILENTWQVYSAELEGTAPMVKFSITGHCHPVKPGIYLPVALNLEGMVDFMGNAVTMNYQVTIRYTEVLENKLLLNPLQPAIDVTVAAATNADASKNTNTTAAALKKKMEDPQQQKRTEKIQDLMDKEELSNRDMQKLAKLVQQSSDALQEKTLDLSSRYKVEVTDSARALDSAAWNARRPIPLKEEEVQSLQRADSIEHLLDDDDTVSHKRFPWLSLMLGQSINFNEKKSRFRFNLLNVDDLSFNAVDGLRYGVTAQLRHTTPTEQQWRISANVVGAFQRKTLMGKFSTDYRYNPQRRAVVNLSVEWQDFDYNSQVPFKTPTYSLAALLFHTNYSRLYEQFRVQLYHAIDVANGFEVAAQLSYADRWKLSNHTDFAFFFPNKNYADNVPYNAILDNDFALHTTATVDVWLHYTPDYYYRMRGQQKIMVKSKYPTFTLYYKKAIPQIGGSATDYDLLTFAVRQKIPAGLMRQWTYRAEVAAFLNNRVVDFPDFYHFNIQGFAWNHPLANNPSNRYYQYATNRWAVSADVGHVTPFLLLKYIPRFDKTYCRENIKWHGHYSPHIGYYNELHYSISEIFLFIEMGVFVGFEDDKFAVFGVDAVIKSF